MFQEVRHDISRYMYGKPALGWSMMQFPMDEANTGLTKRFATTGYETNSQHQASDWPESL
ncbi:MAG: hypothetical protein ACO2ZL_04770 [Flavobacteriales bacterium]